MTRMLVLFLAFAINSSAFANKVYFGQFQGIDGNGVLKVLIKNKTENYRLAYVLPPRSKGQYKDDYINHVKSKFTKSKWMRLTETGLTSEYGVKSAIIRNEANEMLNVTVLSHGLATVSVMENPPKSMLDAQKVAEDQKNGLWQNFEEYRKQNKVNLTNHIMDTINSSKEVFQEKRNANPKHQLAFGDKKTKLYWTLDCIGDTNLFEMERFTTVFAAENKGYKAGKCARSK